MKLSGLIVGGQPMHQLPPFLRWAPDPDDRPPPDSGAGRYIRSFLFERLVVGALGIVLPFSLVFIDWLVFHGHPVPRDSESAYYYSGMREWFTVTVGTCGFFFIAYRITESTLENTLSVFGGAAALLIAIFPTDRTKFERTHGVMKTPLQKLLGEHNVAHVHVVSAFVFIIAIGGISILFGLASEARLAPCELLAHVPFRVRRRDRPRADLGAGDLPQRSAVVDARRRDGLRPRLRRVLVRRRGGLRVPARQEESGRAGV